MTKSTEQARITFRLPQIEYDRLQAESERTGRTKTDILREFIRTLPEPEPEPESKPEKKSEKK
jgi:predicted DNA-binding protein